MYSLLLNDDWDITLNGAGNIATAVDDYAIAQNVANAVRLFLNDAFFNLTSGIPHYTIELGMKDSPSVSILTSRIKESASQVDGVTSASVELEIEEDRVLGGEITIITVNNIRLIVEI